MEGDVPAAEDPGQGGAELRVVAPRVGATRRRQPHRARHEVAAEGRKQVVAQLRYQQCSEVPVAGIAVEPHHGHGPAQVLDVGEARVAVVERVDHVEHAQRVGASPVEDLATDLQVDARVQRAAQPGLLQLQLRLVAAERVVRVLVGVAQAVDGVVEAEAGDAQLPVLGQRDVRFERELGAQPVGTVPRLAVGERRRAVSHRAVGSAEGERALQGEPARQEHRGRVGLLARRRLGGFVVETAQGIVQVAFLLEAAEDLVEILLGERRSRGEEQRHRQRAA